MSFAVARGTLSSSHAKKPSLSPADSPSYQDITEVRVRAEDKWNILVATTSIDKQGKNLLILYPLLLLLTLRRVLWHDVFLRRTFDFAAAKDHR